MSYKLASFKDAQTLIRDAWSRKDTPRGALEVASGLRRRQFRAVIGDESAPFENVVKVLTALGFQLDVKTFDPDLVIFLADNPPPNIIHAGDGALPSS
jgi:hypothetical protein